MGGADPPEKEEGPEVDAPQGLLYERLPLFPGLRSDQHLEQDQDIRHVDLAVAVVIEVLRVVYDLGRFQVAFTGPTP